MEQPSDFHWLALLEKSLSNKLPNDVVLEILQRLPVKSILRFKCVSKLWCSLFSHPNFVRIHLKEAIAGTHYLLLRHMVLEEKEVNLWRVHQGASSSDSDIMYPAEDQEVDPDPSTRRMVYQGKLWNERERFSLRSRENVEELRTLQVPTPSSTSYYTLVGCFNGLVCINESNFSDTYHTLNMSFWNPATRELRSLPKYFTRTRRLSGSLLVVGIGFGHEPVTNDYKVVRFIYFNRSKTYEAETYSLRRNCWKRISAENIYGCYFPQHVPQATTNGALHWMVYKDRDYVNDSEFIIAFRLDHETLSKIPLPTINPEDRVSHICKRVSVFQNQLALFTHFPLAPDKKFNIWVMKEYGNPKTWTRLDAVRQEEFMVPLHFVGNNLVIMKRKKDGEMVLGDSKFRRIRDLNVSSWWRVANYVESLVSPKPGRRGGETVVHNLFSYGSILQAR